MLTWDATFDLRVDSAQPGLLRLLARAQALADVIRDIPLPPRVQTRLHRLNILRAVRGTTGIEGIELSPTEMEAIADASPGEHVLAQSRHDEEQEARNAYDVMRFISGSLDAQPDQRLSIDFICELNRMLLAGVEHAASAGLFRTTRKQVGDYLPPSPEQIAELMNRLIKWFDDPAQKDLDAVVRAVLAHFLLVSIHPFADGNGRTARAIESFLLYQRTGEGGGINTRGFYSLANVYYRRRAEYFRLLDAVRVGRGHDATPLVVFAARGLVDELDGLCKEILHHVRVIAFRDYVRGHLSRNVNLRAGSRSRLLRFVLSLLDLQVHAGQAGVPLHQLREGEGLLAALYEGKSVGTLNRDLKYLQQEKLVVIREGFIRANLDQMSEFTV